jgi:hypothetical protein
MDGSMPASGARSWSPSLAIASATTLVAALGYLWLIGQQGDAPGLDARHSFVLAYLLGVAAVAAVGAVARLAPVRVAAAAACGAAVLPLGFLSLFSIGIVLVMAGLVAMSAWVVAAAEAPRGSPVAASVGGAILAVAALIAGLLAT